MLEPGPEPEPIGVTVTVVLPLDLVELLVECFPGRPLPALVPDALCRLIDTVLVPPPPPRRLEPAPDRWSRPPAVEVSSGFVDPYRRHRP